MIVKTVIKNPTQDQIDQIRSQIQIVYWGDSKESKDKYFCNDTGIARVNVYSDLEHINDLVQYKEVEFDEFINDMCVGGL